MAYLRHCQPCSVPVLLNCQTAVDCIRTSCFLHDAFRLRESTRTGLQRTIQVLYNSKQVYGFFTL